MTKNQRKIILRKIDYYSSWYREMPLGDRIGWLGHWVKTRVDYFSQALVEMEQTT